jgi:hypothetical protein
MVLRQSFDSNESHGMLAWMGCFMKMSDLSTWTSISHCPTNPGTGLLATLKQRHAGEEKGHVLFDSLAMPGAQVSWLTTLQSAMMASTAPSLQGYETLSLRVPRHFCIHHHHLKLEDHVDRMGDDGG